MSNDCLEKTYDAIIVGGSYAGMSAALQLARARRQVLVIDAGQRRNRYALHSNGFLSQDGSEGAAIAAEARAQLLAYPTVSWLQGSATMAVGTADDFRITVPGGVVRGRRLVLATGMVDVLPPVDGLAERWGTSVLPCPYCDGFELQQGPIGVLASGPHVMHLAMLLPDWGQVTLFLNGAFAPDDSQLDALVKRGVTVEQTPVVRVDGKADVMLRDGRHLAMAGLFVSSQPFLASPLAEQLGCALESGPMGQYVGTDGLKATSVAGVYCAGDAARVNASVALAVGDGAMAGIAAHQSLVFGVVANAG